MHVVPAQWCLTGLFIGILACIAKAPGDATSPEKKEPVATTEPVLEFIDVADRQEFTAMLTATRVSYDSIVHMRVRYEGSDDNYHYASELFCPERIFRLETSKIALADVEFAVLVNLMLSDALADLRQPHPKVSRHADYLEWKRRAALRLDVYEAAQRRREEMTRKKAP